MSRFDVWLVGANSPTEQEVHHGETLQYDSIRVSNKESTKCFIETHLIIIHHTFNVFFTLSHWFPVWCIHYITYVNWSAHSLYHAHNQECIAPAFLPASGVIPLDNVIEQQNTNKREAHIDAMTHWSGNAKYPNKVVHFHGNCVYIINSFPLIAQFGGSFANR